MTTIHQWLELATEDPDLHKELSALLEQNDSEGINDRFYRSLAFGTGGLRGIIGAGTNRMNLYTVGQATQGLANYLLAEKLEKRVAIAYDSRIKSDAFAHYAARVLAANGITALLYPELMPTPALSFAVRHHQCGAGICITASHNPAEYNGYKVYGPDGCQITTEAAGSILQAIDEIDLFQDVHTIPLDEGLESKTIQYLPQSTMDAFLQAVWDQRLTTASNQSLSVVYTPLNGAGFACVTQILERTGVGSLAIVESQKQPDGNFPTCPYPNPEEPQAMEEGLKLSKQLDADLLLATDPDCDRVGVIARNQQGEYQAISGNEMGVLLLDYVCRKHLENHTMPTDPIAVKTIVTTELAERVAKKYHVSLRNVLTGFKFIGEQIGQLELAGQTDRYLFGFEESYGYLSGSHVRDKDAVNASMLICDMAQEYHKNSMTLIDALEQLYQEHGFYLNGLDSFTFPGEAGFRTMQTLMQTLRQQPFKQIAKLSVVYVKDYLWTEQNSAASDLPSSDVLQFSLEGGHLITIRPSGTEPKLKLYYSIVGETKQQAADCMAAVRQDLQQLFQS